MLLVTGVANLFGDGITNLGILVDSCGRVAQVGKTVRLLNWIYATGMFLFLPLVIVIARQFFLFVL